MTSHTAGPAIVWDARIGAQTGASDYRDGFSGETLSSHFDAILSGRTQGRFRGFKLRHHFKSNFRPAGQFPRGKMNSEVFRLIKYLGSKRTLLPQLMALASASEAKTALDLFTGTTRVAQGFKKAGIHVTAVDSASYSEALAKTFIEFDANAADSAELEDAIRRLNSLEPAAGYFTKTFCEDARYLQPSNGALVDAAREVIETDYRDTWLYWPLLTALLLAADRVDSTTGLQMAYLKNWSARSFNRLELKAPELLPGSGVAIRGDAMALAPKLPAVDLAYLDPPYNQHRYFTNYHVWESLIRWDKPETYGIANKREDARSDEHRSVFNSKRTMPNALRELISGVNAETLVLSYNNESWLDRDELIAACEPRGHVEVLDIEFRRYVGSQIGIYGKDGSLVGKPGKKRNVEHIVIVGDKSRVQRMVESVGK
jgi:adenine-specific DNA-methyltransferase